MSAHKPVTGTLMLLALTTLAASCSKPTPPIVSACMKLGSSLMGSTPSQLASTCACFEATARRQLEEDNYRALDKAAQIVLEETLAGKSKLIEQAFRADATEKLGATDIPIAAAEFILLADKFSNRCTTG